MLAQDLEELNLNYSLCRKFLGTTGKRASKEAVLAFQEKIKQEIITKLEKIKSLSDRTTIQEETIEMAFEPVSN